MEDTGLILFKIQLLEKMYESMRLVDPVSKKVLEIKDRRIREIDSFCYDIWDKHNLCDNCISMRAYNENDTIFKMERKKGVIYMITAIPITYDERRIVVELLKEVTKSLYVDTGDHVDGVKVFTTVEYMNQMAVKDELTNLYNRRYINEKLPVDLLKASINNKPLSIIFADLDFFKAINDSYGHSVGDQVLRSFADELKRHVRSGRDWIARYGGDEFMICLPNTGNDVARDIAERIRRNIADYNFKTDKMQAHITCSFGVHTVYNEIEPVTVEGVIELADKKLYQAKSEGRNKVV